VKADKKLPANLQSQLQMILKDHMQGAFRRNKKRFNRNGDGSPLSAWMLGAEKDNLSKINSVCNGSARFPYGSVGHASEELSRRIAIRYSLTWLQYDLVSKIVYGNYRGKYQDGYWYFLRIGIVSELDKTGFTKSKTPYESLDKACKKLHICISELPLRAIIDPLVTNIFLLMQLDDCLKNKTYE
jgi:hypothetical protein